MRQTAKLLEIARIIDHAADWKYRPLVEAVDNVMDYWTPEPQEGSKRTLGPEFKDSLRQLREALAKVKE